MTRPKRPKRKGSFFAGEKRGGNRVRLYPHPRDGVLFLEYRDENGKRHNRSLRDSDWKRGKVAAEELATALRKNEEPRASELTLRELFDNYEREVTPRKSEQKQQHDRAARALFEACWGPMALVKELDRRDWDRFIEERSGRLRPAGRDSVGGVRNRMIAYDLKFLMAACNWAEVVRVKGRPMLERNPFRKFPVPAEASPRRPSISESEYQALCVAARGCGPEVELFLYLVHESGHRSDSVANLRWSDIDLVGRTVFWRKDKMKHQHTTPLLPEHVEVIGRVKRQTGRIGDGWVFQSEREPEQPVGRNTVRHWWDRLEALANLPQVKGRGWHSLRRKFADENDELPLSQLMALGGWKSSKTVVEIYQSPSEEKLRVAMNRRAEMRKAARLPI